MLVIRLQHMAFGHASERAGDNTVPHSSTYSHFEHIISYHIHRTVFLFFVLEIWFENCCSTSRWLKGVTTAPPEDLCLEAAVCAADNRARGGGMVGVPPPGVPAVSATSGRGYQLAAVALAVEPIVRG